MVTLQSQLHCFPNKRRSFPREGEITQGQESAQMKSLVLTQETRHQFSHVPFLLVKTFIRLMRLEEKTFKGQEDSSVGEFQTSAILERVFYLKKGSHYVDWANLELTEIQQPLPPQC